MSSTSTSSRGNFADQEARVCDFCTFKSSPLLPDSGHASELRQILHSNMVPSSSVSASLRDVIHRAPAELERYDAEIHRISLSLSELVSQRVALESHVDVCRGVLSPVRRLPMELLAEIFEMSTAPFKDRKLANSATPRAEQDGLGKYDLLQLSQVCSRWHSVALGTSRLWSTIALDTECWRRPLSQAKALSLIACALERSQAHLLTVGLWLEAGDWHARKVMELLGPHAERWQCLYLSAAGNSSQHLSVVKGRLHSLTTVNFALRYEGLDALAVAPALHTVSFTGAPKYIPRLPWSQIRIFKFFWRTDNLFAPSTAFFTARLLGRAAQFRFNAELKNPDAEWVSVSSDLGCLFLALELASESAKFVLGRILGSLTLPHLEQLNLGPRRDTLPVWNSDQFAAFAARSSLHTHLLCLHLRVVITDDELLEALSVLPSLESLTLSGNNDHTSITDVLLEGLTWNPERRLSILPKLEHLSLSSRRQFSDAAYVDCLLTRAQLRLDAGNTPFRAHLRV
ncbi:hypothetical protein DFH06DRAFT_372835 [Mycena polygramma]|nr:hypothetical protein DFH06DRAFT_372835 [Mycena polygramma]